MSKLGEYLTVKHGWAFKGEFFSEFGTHSILTPGNFYEKGGFKHNDEKERYYTGEYPPEYLCKKGDLIIAMTEQAAGLLGSTAIVPEDNRYLHNQRVGLVFCDEKKLVPLYAYYLFMTNSVREQIARSSSGTKVKHTSPEKIYDVQVCLPDTKVQTIVSDFLWRIDSKIEVNNRMCSELETMAKTLYDYWFVQFDFPDENGRPYRTSGGEMIWNEQLKREIPKGWDVASINQMTQSYRGVSYDKKDLLPTPENGVLVLRGNNIQNNRLVYDNNVAYIPYSFVAKEQQIHAHDIILTMSSGSKEHIGKCTIFQYDSPHTYGAFLTKFIPDSNKVSFVYLSMISDFFKKKIKAICNGTGINNLTNETFDNLVFPKPNEPVLNCFEEITAPLLEKMGACERENEELTKLRDWLLPMLMNGQARVE